MRLRGALAVLAVGVASCSGAPEGRGASAPGEQPFAVFTKGQLVIDRLGMPFAPPITVGSTASPQTLRSDAPEIVEVDAAGALVGRRNGRALVRSSTDPAQVLEVEVRAASALAVWPAVITIRPGGAAQPLGPAPPQRCSRLHGFPDAASSLGVLELRVGARLDGLDVGRGDAGGDGKHRQSHYPRVVW